MRLKGQAVKKCPTCGREGVLHGRADKERVTVKHIWPDGSVYYCVVKLEEVQVRC